MKTGLVIIAAVSYKNYPIRGPYCDLSWHLTMNMQEMQRFASRVVCRPLIKGSMLLGLE